MNGATRILCLLAASLLLALPAAPSLAAQTSPRAAQAQTHQAAKPPAHPKAKKKAKKPVKHAPWAKERQDGFLYACKKNGLGQTQCGCILKWLEQHLTYQQFISLPPAKRSIMQTAINACTP